MKNRLIEVINSWNPIEIYPLLKDEYLSESKKIMEVVGMTNSIDELAQEVFNIFEQSFGKEFNKSIEECRVIANERLIATGDNLWMTYSLFCFIGDLVS